jgi:hypothetical protein
MLVESIELLSTGRTLALIYSFFLFAGFAVFQHTTSTMMRRLVHRVLHWWTIHHLAGLCFTALEGFLSSFVSLLSVLLLLLLRSLVVLSSAKAGPVLNVCTV